MEKSGTQNGNGSSANSSSVSGSGVSSPGVPERRCIFCLALVAGSDAALNVHYWRRCPMLTRCAHCSQVVEVSTLGAHLAAECERRPPADAVEAVAEGHVRCPLCRAVLEDGEQCWRLHLMGDAACPKNARYHYKQVTIQT